MSLPAGWLEYQASNHGDVMEDILCVCNFVLRMLHKSSNVWVLCMVEEQIGLCASSVINFPVCQLKHQ